MEIPNLESLRKNSGLSIGVIHKELKANYPHICPNQRSGIIHWERQGITDVRVIRALSGVYGKDFSEIEAAALQSREEYMETKKVPN